MVQIDLNNLFSCIFKYTHWHFPSSSIRISFVQFRHAFYIRIRCCYSNGGATIDIIIIIIEMNSWWTVNMAAHLFDVIRGWGKGDRTTTNGEERSATNERRRQNYAQSVRSVLCVFVLRRGFSPSPTIEQYLGLSHTRRPIVSPTYTHWLNPPPLCGSVPVLYTTKTTTPPLSSSPCVRSTIRSSSSLS